MIDQHNIAAYIQFLHQKKHNEPAADALVAQWTSLSDFEIIAQLQALYMHWGIDDATARLYERMFAHERENRIATNIVVPTVNESPAPVQKRNYWPWIILIALVGSIIAWLAIRQNTLEDSATQLQQRIDTVDTKAEQAKKEEEARIKEEQEKAAQQAAILKNAKSNINKYVKYDLRYDVGNMFGGIKNVKLSVSNNSEYKLNELSFRIQYIKKSGEVHETETVKVYNIPARGATTVEAPSSGRGVKATVQLLSVQSDELDAVP